MNFNEFLKMAQENILSYLPEEYKNAKVDIQPVIKNNNVKLHGLIVKKPNQNIVPTIYLDDFYEPDMTAADYHLRMREIAEIRIKHDLQMDVSNIFKAENIKERIVFKLISYDRNEEMLKTLPHKKLNNLAMIYQIDVPQLKPINLSGSATANITYNMMNNYGYTQDMLHELAIKNTPDLRPAVFRDLADVMLLNSDEEIDIKSSEKLEAGMYILSNNSLHDGAATMLYPDVLKNIAAKFNTNIYVVPSSLHEVLIIPKLPGMEESISESITEVNRDLVADDEILSDTLYEYDIAENRLYIAADNSPVYDFSEAPGYAENKKSNLFEKMVQEQRENDLFSEQNFDASPNM